jgi:hypothetical protein
MQNKLFYWFGFQLFNKKVDIQPKEKQLSKSFESYDEAKIERMIYSTQDYQRTSIFEATSKEEAEKKMNLESFNNL